MKVFIVTIESPSEITPKDIQDYIWMNVENITMSVAEITGTNPLQENINNK